MVSAQSAQAQAQELMQEMLKNSASLRHSNTALSTLTTGASSLSQSIKDQAIDLINLISEPILTIGGVVVAGASAIGCASLGYACYAIANGNLSIPNLRYN